MTTEKSSGKLFLNAILIVILLFGLIRIVSEGTGLAKALELLGLMFLLVLTLFAFISYKNWGERVLYFVYLFYIVNLILVWHFMNGLYLVLLLLSLVGFFINLPKKEKKVKAIITNPMLEEAYQSEKNKPYSEIFDLPSEDEKDEELDVSEDEEDDEPVVEPKVTAATTAKKTITKKSSSSSVSRKTSFTPGKLVASKRSNVYHLPKCEWAKKISKERRVWFKSKEEAWEKGYKAHSCVTE